MSTTTDPARKTKQDDPERRWERIELGKATTRVGRLRKENEQLRAELAESQAEALKLEKKCEWYLSTLRQFTARRMEDNGAEG